VQNFIILWLGQLASSIGSSMTYFALTLWVWQKTQSATAIALILVFYQLPQIAASLFSGILVDRVSRQQLLILSDTASACCTVSVGVLAAFQVLQLWHLYLIAAIIGIFSNIQSLTYTTIVPLIVPSHHHTRALSMGAIVRNGSDIIAPALAGILYARVGLLGITLIDLATFAIAILTVFIIPIPSAQPEPESAPADPPAIWKEATFGFRYIASQPHLLAMTIALSAFTFLNQIGETLYQPMILARTGGNAQVLGTVVAAAGVGGVIGAVVLSFWSGFRRRVFGMLIGFIGTGLSKLIMGMGQVPTIWALTQLGVALHSPLILSSYTAVWYSNVAPALQGRVFAADYLIGFTIEAAASLSAGLLADQVFEPALRSGQGLIPIVGSIVGTGSGSGMALLYLVSAIGILLIGFGGFMVRQLRDAETVE
jgi:MFS transporter, DHA3 family, macrolide efflux protein